MFLMSPWLGTLVLAGTMTHGLGKGIAVGQTPPWASMTPTGASRLRGGQGHNAAQGCWCVGSCLHPLFSHFCNGVLNNLLQMRCKYQTVK